MFQRLSIAIDYRVVTRTRFALLVLATVLGVACAHRSPIASLSKPGDLKLAACTDAFARDERAILHAGVRDPEFKVIANFPYLRSNRFMASFAGELGSDAQRAAWLGRLADLDERARTIEWRNLAPRYRPEPAHQEFLGNCRKLLVEDLRHRAMAVTQVYAAAAIPDDYSLSSRIFGLYPLSAPFVLRGVHRLHRKEQAKFYNADAIATRTTDFTGYRIADSTADQLDQTLFSKLERDALGIPIIKTTQLSELFRAYAPIWLLEEQSRDDRIATVVFANDGPGVNSNKASLYTYVSYARFAAKVVTQLNYVVWFAARPKQGFFDILGGAFDSITYRVTLDEDGEILLIDTMHSCGCYYMAFPSRALKQRETQQSFSEPLWVPYAIDTGERRRFAIVLSATRHYVRGVGPAGDIKTSRELIVRSYDDLKQLAFGADEFVNLFAPDGLVAASARSERFLLWPMGIASPGAMRVAGHHAIAFVGRRHFDDPDLLDRFFERIK